MGIRSLHLLADKFVTQSRFKLTSQISHKIQQQPRNLIPHFLPEIEGTTQKIDFFSVVLFDTKPPLQDSKFYADFKYVIYFKNIDHLGHFLTKSVKNCPNDQKWRQIVFSAYFKRF